MSMVKPMGRGSYLYQTCRVGKLQRSSFAGEAVETVALWIEAA